MRKIDKGKEPSTFTDWKKKHSNVSYDNLPPEQKQEIRRACIQEQYSLCAYCCKRISLEDSHNEHVEARQLAQGRQLDFNNIVASCNTEKRCGKAHGHQRLPLTPLMPECESEFEFRLNGAVKGLTQRAQESIQILNLGDKNQKLISTRKQMIDALLYKEGIQPVELELESDERLQELLDSLRVPTEGNLEAFSPVLINILKFYLQKSPVE